MKSRTLGRLVALLTVAASLLAIAAPSASAAIAPQICYQPTYAYNYGCGVTQHQVKTPVPANYDSAYAYVSGRADCPAYSECFAGGEPTILAWHWTGYEWTRSSLNRDERVWVRSFGSGWSWAWTPRTGYLAIQTSRLYTWTWQYGDPCPTAMMCAL